MTSSTGNGVMIIENDWHSYDAITWPYSDDSSKKLSKLIKQTTFYKEVSISRKHIELQRS